MPTASQAQSPIYVNDDATGNNDGSSWEHAYTDLQMALKKATNGGEIWVASGVYKPTSGTSRAEAFDLKSGMALYGGFAGVITETKRSQRDWERHETILSGEIGDVAVVTDNSLHVVKAIETKSTAVLDGFLIEKGYNANSLVGDNKGAGMKILQANPTINNVVFRDNKALSGGALANYESSPTLTNVVFEENIATQAGGGMAIFLGSSPTLNSILFVGNSASEGAGLYISEGEVVLTNVIFKENKASSNGGAIYAAASSIGSNRLINVTMNGNSANQQGGGIFNQGSTITIDNSIIWGNKDSSGSKTNTAQIIDLTNFITANHNLIQGGWSGKGSDNKDSDPFFVNPPDDLRIDNQLSPAVDNLQSSFCPKFDFDGIARPQDGNGDGKALCDLGAFERQAPFSCANVTQISTKECEALVSLYNATNGEAWTDTATNKWLDTLDPCEWSGIGCSSIDGDSLSVAKIGRESKNLVGTIPLTLGNLSQLTELSLASNTLSGPIPSELGSLTNLEILDLGTNQLSGTLPIALSQLSQLEALHLNQNKLSGSLPAEFGTLTKLENLSLNDNLFSGPIPSQWGNLSDLTSLTLNNNAGVSGLLPQSLRQISNLNTFKFSDTQLCEPPNSEFQTWLGKISDLSSTDIKCNPILTISKTGPTNVDAGDPITYQLTIKNSGIFTATALQITDTIPSGATVIGMNGGQLITDGTVIRWQVDRLAINQTVQVGFVVAAESDIVNRDYRVVSQGGYSSIGTTAVTTVVNPRVPPVLTITKSAPALARQGTTFVYTLTVKNIGSVKAENFHVYDYLPDGVTYAGNGDAFDGQTVRWLSNTLNVGESLQRTYQVTATELGLVINRYYGLQLADGPQVVGILPVTTYVERQGEPAVDFGPPQRFGSRNGRSIALADLDLDGDLDMLVGNASPNEVWLNNGTGVFTQSVNLGGGDSEGVVLGDLNGDGYPDAIIANSNNQTNTVWLNNGTGVFTQSINLGSGDSQGVALGDLNGDGSLDTVIVNSSSQTNTVWLNNGSGVFTQSVGLGGGDSQGVALGDLNGDNSLDMVIVNGNSQTNTVWLNNGSGVFTQSVSLGGGDSQGVALGDLNDDGSLDVVISNQSNQPNEVWLNNGSGVFTQSQSLGNSDSQAVSLGDLNGDGNLDIFVGNGNNQPNEVWVNNGDGTFSNNGRALESGNSNAVALGDLNQDCVPDVVVAQQNSLTQAGSNQILINQAQSTCSSSYLPIILK